MKKIYQQPLTTSIEVQPQSILCASPGAGGFIIPGSSGDGGGMI